MHKVFCIIGRTASGKSTITNRVAKKLNLNILKSYTTRGRRSNEIGDNCDHTFIKPDEVSQYLGHMVAYTERPGYCSFATREQLMNSDFYIINPSGFIELQEKTKDINNLELIDIWIQCDKEELKKRGWKRDDYNEWYLNFLKENDEFEKIYQNVPYRYIVNNSGNLNNSVHTVEEIVIQELGLYK